ncbi:cysteine-rich motor neuron 1 protein-like [Strongylocentrotus purpuratus]|uniref:Antistasin-like domain-containing protein n=1 Tax=Strongylocentrotus purpuratus TaxID=7668 RepID=A0A7M7NHL6_STRPU|nr:cysteine-rich motor neuron 1 protein-like [Strongylocentrotus purpuratus]
MCKSTLSLCPAVTLEDCPLLMVCERGLATDASDCEVCRCKADMHPFLPPKDTLFESSSSEHHASYPSVKLVAEITNCPPVRCDIDCRETNFATNALGCPTCECAQTG